MTKATTAQLDDLLVALTARVNELSARCTDLATRLVEAHARIDAMQPRDITTPDKLPSITRGEFLNALADLRADAGAEASTLGESSVNIKRASQALFAPEVIKARAHALRAA